MVVFSMRFNFRTKKTWMSYIIEVSVEGYKYFSNYRSSYLLMFFKINSKSQKDNNGNVKDI